MDDQHALTDAQIDHTLEALFVQARAATPANPALVQRILTDARAQQRRRSRVLWLAVLAGGVAAVFFLAPALAILTALLSDLAPLSEGLIGAETWLRAPGPLLALGFAMVVWLGVDSAESA